MKIWFLMTAGLIVGLVIGAIGMDYFTKPEYIEVPVEVIKEVEHVEIKTVKQEVPVIKEVEVIREVPIEARFFETVAEFEEWVENNHGLITSGSASFNKHDPMNDCEDQADRWQKRALEDGYIVSVCPVYNGRIFNQQIFETDYPYHVGLWTSVGNNYYYWEGVTGEITKLGVVRD